MLTEPGRRFLPHALAFLPRAEELCRAVDLEVGGKEVRVAASRYLIRYVLSPCGTAVQQCAHLREGAG